MNIFLPQSIQTQIELEEIAGVERQIISPTNSKTIIGIVQDGLLGAYNLTSPSIRIDWRNSMNILSYTTIEDFGTLRRGKEYTGHEIYSLIMPAGINVDRATLTIKNGVIEKGRLSKEYLGSGKKNNLIQLIWDNYGVEETKKFIDNTQRLVNNFNLYNGFTAGYGSACISKEIADQIDKLYNTAELEVEHMITEIENNPDIMQHDVFEMKLHSKISNLRENVSKIVMNSLSEDNDFGIMINSGSKGDASNMGQMSGSLGMQTFEGKMVPKKYNKRTLAYFHQNDDRGVARGLVRNPFINGLEFPEFVFHLLASRLGLIEQSIKTSETGYAQRKLVKSLEDIMIKYDGTVRTANELMLQPVYGSSGTDTTKQYEYNIKLIEMNNAEIEKTFKFTKDELAKYKFSEKENDAYYKHLIEVRNIIRNSVRKAKLNYILLTSTFMLPVNIKRIIDNSTNSKNDEKNSTLTPSYILEKLDELMSNDKTPLMCMNEAEKKDVNSVKQRDEIAHKFVIKAAVHDAFSPKRVLNEYKFSKKQFDKVCDEISEAFIKNQIEPGELVGVIAAQSMGEPLTQFTLNSVDWTEKIIMRDTQNNITIASEIGDIIDNLISENKSKVKHIGDNIKNEMGDTYYLDISEKEIYVPSVNENGKITWNLVEAVTKHLPINKDGTNTLLKVTTRLGKQVMATKAKSFLTMKKNKIVPIRGDELEIGTYLPIISKISCDLDEKMQNLFDKYVNKEEILESDKFTLTVDKNEIELVCFLMSIYNYIAQHNDNVLTFTKSNNNEFNDVYFDQIVSIEEVNPTNKYVYDLTVEETKTFCLLNGLCCMDSFHHSGIASVSATTQGVPRIKEIFGVSKNPKTPQMTIYLENEFKNSKEMSHKIASQIKYTTLGDIRSRINVYYDPLPKAKGSIMEQDNIKHIFYGNNGKSSSCQGDVNGLPWLLRIEIDRDKMLEKEVTLLEIKSKFCNWWDKRTVDSKKKEEKKVINKVTQLAVLSNSDNDIQPILHIRFNVKDSDKDRDQFNMTTINDFIDFVIDKFKLKGINSVDDISAIPEERMLVFNDETGDVEKASQYVIYTSGVNLIDIRYLIGIDLSKTVANDIVENYKIFGIEIARTMLLKEISSAYEKAGGEVNYQHVSLIVDLMTSSGSITSIDRHGMGRTDTDPLSRASFEKSVEQLLNASVFGETDHMKGISSRIMAGAVIKGGTGYCDVVLDTEMIEKSEFTEEVDYGNRFTEVASSTIAEDIKTQKKKHGFFVPS